MTDTPNSHNELSIFFDAPYLRTFHPCQVRPEPVERPALLRLEGRVPVAIALKAIRAPIFSRLWSLEHVSAEYLVRAFKLSFIARAKPAASRRSILLLCGWRLSSNVLYF
jgi:hypothetical protein